MRTLFAIQIFVGFALISLAATTQAWDILTQGPVGQGVGEGAPPMLLGDAIILGKEGASSVLVYWAGNAYAAYWQGD